MTRPTWDEYFLAIAEVVATRSVDPDTKHGCVLVDRHNRIISTGYNGPIAGIRHLTLPLTRPEKYKWMIHAEDNAVCFATRSLEGATAYVTGMPCYVCLRRMAQCGVTRVVHSGKKSACVDTDDFLTSMKMIDLLAQTDKPMTIHVVVPGSKRLSPPDNMDG